MSTTKQLEFTLAIDDAIACAEYHARRSRANHKSRRRVQVVFAVIFFGVGLSFALGGEFGRASFYAAVGVASILLWPRFYFWLVRREMLKAYKEGTNRATFGRHRVQLEPDGIAWSSEHSEGKYRWSSVERVVTAPDHTFVYVGAIMAFIIPRRTVLAGDYDAFVRELADQHKLAAA